MSLAFALNTKSEILKCRKTAAYWLTISGAALVPLMMTFAYIMRPDIFVPKFKSDPWNQHLMQSWQSAAAFLLPMYVILVTSLVVQTEYKNNTWKQVYASPRSYTDIYFSKFLVIHLLIISCFILFNIMIILGGLVTAVFQPGYHFLETAVPWKTMLMLSFKLYISILGVTAIQYWLSLRLKNYIMPLGIGLALLFMALLILNWEKAVYFPYSYTALAYFRAGGKHEYYSLIWFAVITVLGFIDTINRKERG